MLGVSALLYSNTMRWYSGSLTSQPLRVRVPVGGDQERVEIHLIAHPDDDQTEARRSLTEQFATFKAGKAQCFLASDREHLLAVIEAGFGDFDDFNRAARNILASRLHDELSTRSHRTTDIDTDMNEASLRPTKGHLVADGQICIVSFPASLGQKAWNGMVAGGRVTLREASRSSDLSYQ